MIATNQRLHALAAIGLVVIVTTGCMQGPGFLQQSAQAPSSIISESTDGLTGQVMGDNTTTMSASQGDMNGVEVAILPGTVAIGTSIDVLSADNIVTDAAAIDLGMGSSMGLEAASTAVAVMADTTEVNQPFTISLPLPSGAGLALADQFEKLIVIYKAPLPTGGHRMGVIPRQLLTIAGGKVVLSTEFFGVFQAAFTSEVMIAVPAPVVMQSSLATKADVRMLPPVVFNFFASATSDRKAKFEWAPTGLQALERCTLFVDTDQVAPWDLALPMVDATSYTYAATVKAAHLLNSRISCREMNGRELASEWTSVQMPLVKADSPNSNTSPTTAVVTIASLASSAYINVANQSAYLLQGACSHAGVAISLLPINAAPLCSAGLTWSYTFSFVGVGISDGLVTFTATHAPAGVAAKTVSLIRTKDTSAPIFTGVASISTPLPTKTAPTLAAAISDGTLVWSRTTGSGTLTFANATAATTTVSASATGTYGIQATAIDAAGNSSSSAIVTLVWDVTPPNAPVFSGQPAPVSRDLVLNVNVASGGGSPTGYRFKVDDSATCATTGDYAAATVFTNVITTSTGGFSEGPLYLCAYAVDAAGNMSTPVVYSWVKDTTPPTLASASISADSVLNNVVTLTWTSASDLVSSQANLEYFLCQSSTAPAVETVADCQSAAAAMDWTPNVSNFMVTGLTQVTTYHMRVLVRDLAGNISAYDPIEVTTIAVMTQVSGGEAHTCGIDVSNKLWCWGKNQSGQLGTGNTDATSKAKRVDANDWVSVSAGAKHTCAIRMNDELYCWGSNFYGQLGIGNTNQQNTPVSIAGAWQSVEAGETHTCAINSSSAMMCWGYNFYGQLASGDTTSQNSPATVSGAQTWSKVSAGSNLTCGIKLDNTLHCWGGHSSYGVGDGTTTQRLIPTAISGSDTWSDVSVGQNHVCAIKVSGSSMWCWGNATLGILGNGTETASTSPVAVSGGHAWSTVSLSPNHSCGKRTDGVMMCWGGSKFGQIGALKANQTTPRLVAAPTSWAAFGAGSNHSCGILTDGRTACFGANGDGQLGNGKNGTSHVPSKVLGGPWSEISLRREHACAVDQAGKLFCWGGSPYDDQIPVTPQRVYHASPIQVGTAADWMLPVTGSSQTLAIKTDGLYSAAGGGVYYRLGNGSTSGYSSLTQVGSSTWNMLSAHSGHGCGIRTLGELYCWGYNVAGQVGDDSFSDRQTPLKIGIDTDWDTVSVSATHTCGIRGGQLSCWGLNSSGQLGDATTTNRKVPTPLTGTWSVVSAAKLHTCAISSSGGLHCWGENSSSQLGDGTVVDLSTPTAVDGSTDWVNVATGDYHSCALKSNGTLYCWGKNNYRQTGSAPGGIVSVPTQVGVATNWTKLVAGEYATCAINDYNDAYCWGSNHAGQLGDGRGHSESVVQVAFVAPL